MGIEPTPGGLNHELPPAPPEPKPRLQFGSRTVLAIAASFAVLFALGACFGPLGYAIFFLAAPLVAFALSPPLRRPEVLLLYFVLVVLAIAWKVWPSLEIPQPPR